MEGNSVPQRLSIGSVACPLHFAINMKIFAHWQSLNTDLFRVCVHCGSYLIRESDLLAGCRICCAECLQEVERTQNQDWCYDYEHVVVSAYPWGKFNDKRARNLVRGLKGGGRPVIFKYFAEKICLLRMKKQIIEKNKIIYIIPAPSSDEKNRDHAGELALAIASLTAGRYLSVLERRIVGEQKYKTERERRAETVILGLKSNCREYEVVKRSPGKIIFVDDIITTGKTAHSAYIALGKPKDFEIWTIFNRIRLRV